MTAQEADKKRWGGGDTTCPQYRFLKWKRRCEKFGKEKRGIREGCPTIADEVWIGANAVVVGRIQIGSDVLIAPGAYVNFDVPSHSIVVGNPAKIVAKENATEKYIKNTV